MEFGAASAIPEKYRHILADEGLVGRLAYRLSLHSIGPEDEKAVASEFRSLISDLANERMLGKLVEMRERAEGKERKVVQAALFEALERIGKNGSIEGPAELLRRDDLPLKIRRAAEDAILEGMEICCGGGRVSLVVGLLGMEWLSEEIHAKALEVAGRSHYVDYAEYMEKAIALLGMEWASPELREDARGALLEWGIARCLDRADPDDTWTLLGLDEKGSTVIKELDKGKMVSLVLGLIPNENAGEAVRTKAVEAAVAAQYIERERIIEALEDALEREMPPALMEAVGKALETCGAQKFAVECSGKTPEELVAMRASAKTGEKRFVDEAIISRFREWGEGGRAEGLVAMLERKDLSQRLRREGERELLDAVDFRAGAGDTGALLKILKKGWLPEKVRMRIIEAATDDPHADCMRLVEALGDVLAGKGEAKGLRAAAKKALPGAVDECIMRKEENFGMTLGAAASLFKKGGVPWESINKVAKACSKTGQWTKVAHLFRRHDLTAEGARVAEKVLLDSMEFFGQKALAAGATREEQELIGQAVHVMWERRLPESVYLKGIELCRRHVGVQGYSFVVLLADMLGRPDATQKIKDAAEGALVEEELGECAAAGYSDFLVKVYKSPGATKKIQEKIRQIFEMRRRLEEMEEKRKAEEAEVCDPRKPTRVSGDQGFVDSKVRPPGSGKKAIRGTEERIATDPTRKAEIVKKD